MNKIYVLFTKEFKDILSDDRFKLSFSIMLIAVSCNAITASQNYKDQINQMQYDGIQMDYTNIALPIFTFDIIASLQFFGPILAISLIFTSIVKEINSGTIKILLSYPVYRDQILISKFLSGVITISFVSISSFVLGMGIIKLLTGFDFNGNMILRLLFVCLLTIMYLTIFISIGMLFSVLLNDSSSVMLYSMFIFITMVSLFPIASHTIATLIYGSQMRVTTSMGDTYLAFLPTDDFLFVSRSYKWITPFHNYKEAAEILVRYYRMNVINGVWTEIFTPLIYSVSMIIPVFAYQIGIIIISYVISYLKFRNKNLVHYD